jgi:hypothetical protein
VRRLEAIWSEHISNKNVLTFDDFDGFDSDAMAVNEELDRFREEWLREVRKQSQHNAQSPPGAQPVAATEPPTSPKDNATKPSTPRAPRSSTARRPTDLSLSTASYPTVESSRPKPLPALVCLHVPLCGLWASMTQASLVL